MAQVLELLPVVWEIREFPDSWLQSCPDFTVQVLSALQNNKLKKNINFCISLSLQNVVVENL